jgi:hypothetical protein
MKLPIDRTGWAMPLVGILGTSAAIAGALTFVYGNRSVFVGGAIAFLFGAPLGIIGIGAWLNGYPYLVADVPARMLHYVAAKNDRNSVPFGEIGELAIERRTMKSRRATHYYDLRAAAFGDRVLFTSFNRDVVEKRRALLLSLTAQR